MARFNVKGGPKKELLSVLDQLVIALVEDLRAQRLDQLNPLALRGVGVRAPIAPQIADWLELRLSALLAQKSAIDQRYCAPCRALSTHLEEDAWVIRQGRAGVNALSALSREVGIRSLIDLEVSWSMATNTLLLRARLFDAQSGISFWSEEYRSHPKSTQAQRNNGEDSKAFSRYDDLARTHKESVDHRSLIWLGGGSTPTNNGRSLTTFNLGYSFGEAFSQGDRMRYALNAEISMNISSQFFLGVSLEGELKYRLSSVDSSSTNEGLWIQGGGGLVWAGLEQGISSGVGISWISSRGIGLRVDGFYRFDPSNEVFGGPGVRSAVVYHF